MYPEVNTTRNTDDTYTYPFMRWNRRRRSYQRVDILMRPEAIATQANAECMYMTVNQI
ncbi:hypothetical protein J31TS4_11810 [Paenibacillus sp. J31TS4]|nr:hypothetical protein J31TS4_11810 [Paenibacillus sp. J31TS4]